MPGIPAETPNTNLAAYEALKNALGMKRSPLRTVALSDSNGQNSPGWVRAVARLSGGKIRLVNNASIGGETSAQIASRFGRDVEPFQPDLVMIEIGTNDSAATATIIPIMRSLIKKSRALKSSPYVLVCATIPHYQFISAGLTTKNDLSTLVSSEFGTDPKVIFVDTYTPLLDPVNPASPTVYFGGDVHLTRRGCYKFGETVHAEAAVVTMLSNIYAAPQASASDATRQVVPNPNFDTGAESSGRANNWTTSSSGTAMTMSTGTEAGITGKYQRLTIPAGNTFYELKSVVSTATAAFYAGRRGWSSFKARIVSRPADVSTATAFASAIGISRDPTYYLYGDGQSGFSTSVTSPVLADLEDGVWYYFYNEWVADEVPFVATSIVASGNGNSSAATSLVIDVAEVDWGLFDENEKVPYFPLSASYTDSSGSPGAATINKSSGRSAIALGASSVVITNSRVSSTSVILLTLEDADATATMIRVSSVGSGTFTVSANANATAATKFRWAVIN